MLLKSIDFSQFDGQSKEWKLEGLELGPINLLVGKNAVGKTRAVTIIAVLARLLASEIRPTFTSGSYHVTFDNSGTIILYSFRYENSVIIAEQLKIGEKTYLQRGPGGVGKIFAEKIGDGTYIDFQTPVNELAVVARRDSIQHPYLEPLSEWGQSLRFYPFGTFLGKQTLTFVVKEPPPLTKKTPTR